jgi:hypothetical protein
MRIGKQYYYLFLAVFGLNPEKNSDLEAMMLLARVAL